MRERASTSRRASSRPTPAASPCAACAKPSDASCTTPRGKAAHLAGLCERSASSRTRSRYSAVNWRRRLGHNLRVRGRSGAAGPGGLVATLLDPQGWNGNLITMSSSSLRSSVTSTATEIPKVAGVSVMLAERGYARPTRPCDSHSHPPLPVHRAGDSSVPRFQPDNAVALCGDSPSADVRGSVKARCASFVHTAQRSPIFTTKVSGWGGASRRPSCELVILTQQREP